MHNDSNQFLFTCVRILLEKGNLPAKNKDVHASWFRKSTNRCDKSYLPYLLHTPLCFCPTLTELTNDTILYTDHSFKRNTVFIYLWNGQVGRLSFKEFVISSSLPSAIFWFTEFGENVLLRRYNFMCVRFLLMENSLKWVNHISEGILIAHESKIHNYSYWHYYRWFLPSDIKKKTLDFAAV